MIVHYNHDKPTNVYVVNSRLPVYRAYYIDGLGSILTGLGIAPKVASFVKQLGVIGDLAGNVFSFAKDKITSLVKSRGFPSRGFLGGKKRLLFRH
jgi:hypothetical protein